MGRFNRGLTPWRYGSPVISIPKEPRRLRMPDPLSQPTRFARWPGWACGLALLAFALLVACGVARPVPPQLMAERPITGIAGSETPPDAAGDDVALYRAMAQKVRGGEDYYAAATRLLRDNDYPLRPFVAVRLPTLTYMLAALPPGLAIVPMCLLIAAVILAWTVRLAPALRTPEICSWASLLVMMNCLTAFSPALVVFHESWAALLIALSLALYRHERWWPSVLLALLAVMIRELALPYVLLMGALALLERRWREAAAWAGVTIAFLAALGLHAQAVWAVTSAADPASPGWSASGGWPFVVAAIQKATLFNHLPFAVTPLLVPLALLGWTAWASPTGTRAALFLAGFSGAMMLFGRPDNFYWAVMITPILLVGLIFAPAALRDLARPLVFGAQRAT